MQQQQVAAPLHARSFSASGEPTGGAASLLFCRSGAAPRDSYLRDPGGFLDSSIGGGGVGGGMGVGKGQVWAAHAAVAGGRPPSLADGAPPPPSFYLRGPNDAAAGGSLAAAPLRSPRVAPGHSERRGSGAFWDEIKEGGGGVMSGN